MINLSKIKILEKNRNLVVLLLAAVILLELAWATGRVSKPAIAPAPEEEAAVSEAALALSPSVSTFALGQTFEVQVMLETEDTTTTDGADLQIIFDPAILEALDVSSTDFYPQRLTNTVDGESGVIRLAVSNTPDQEGIKTGGGVIATITFKPLQTGEAEVFFEEATVAQGGLNILSQTSDGVYLIE